jgi:hypothetical protein
VLVVTSNCGEATIDAPEGTYYFFCDQPGHEQAEMRGYLTVKADAEITTASRAVRGLFPAWIFGVVVGRC